MAEGVQGWGLSVEWWASLLLYFPSAILNIISLYKKITHEVCEESSRSASAQLRRLQGADPDDVVDVTVTCDGTWSRRGFVAAYGVVTVLSWETGQVLDVVVLSKSCKVCKEAELSMGSESQEFLEWMEKHQDSCNSNYTSSSPAMEAEGASILWARSVAKNKLWYTVVISDGDAKTISRLNSEHPYGTDVVIQVITFMLILVILWWVHICLHLWWLHICFCCFDTFRRWSVLVMSRSASEKIAWPEEEDLCRWQWSSTEVKVGGGGGWKDAWPILSSILLRSTTEGPFEIFRGTWIKCTEQSGLCSTTLYLMMRNTTTSFSHQDLTHGASTIVHWLIMSNHPSTPLSSQWIWVSSSSQYLLSCPSWSFWKSVCWVPLRIRTSPSTTSSDPGAPKLDSVLALVLKSLSIWQRSPSIMVWKDSRLCLRNCLVFLHVPLQLTILHPLIQSGSKSLCRRQSTRARNGESRRALLHLRRRRDTLLEKGLLMNVRKFDVRPSLLVFTLKLLEAIKFLWCLIFIISCYWPTARLDPLVYHTISILNFTLNSRVCGKSSHYLNIEIIQIRQIAIQCSNISY